MYKSSIKSFIIYLNNCSHVNKMILQNPMEDLRQSQSHIVYLEAKYIPDMRRKPNGVFLKHFYFLLVYNCLTDFSFCSRFIFEKR